MRTAIFKRRDGFEGEKMISIPPKIQRSYSTRFPALFNIYITYIGYFPKASFHYRERRKGCEDNILIYCLQGRGYYVINNKQFVVNANEFFLLPATDQYIRYWADKDDPWTIYWVHFTGSLIDNFNSSLNIGSFTGPSQIPFNAKAIELWQNIYRSLEMGYSMDNLCNANFCLYHLIAAFLFPDKHIQMRRSDNPDIITSSILYMKDNLDKKVSVEDIAFIHRLSASHFSSLFRKATGMPPIDYFIHLKMQKACQYLYGDDVKIKRIAEELGYDDPYYFSRLFKKFMGISPEQYKMAVTRK